MRSRAGWLLLFVLGTACEPDVILPPPAPPTVVALFDPTAQPPVVPTPNDLALMSGSIMVPDQPTDSGAQRTLNAYLRMLNGFPATSVATEPFSGAIAPASVTLTTATAPGSVQVVDTTTGQLVSPTQATVGVGTDGKSVTITPVGRWAPGHRFAVLLFGGDDPNALKGAMGELVIASPTFFFLRATQPLLVRCAQPTDPLCVCPPDALANPNDMTCHSRAQGLSDAQARQAEPQRQALDAALALLLPPNRNRNNLVVFWTFTITTQPSAVFDPTSGNIPFPNDILIDQTTGLVNLPIAPGDPQAAVKMQLNTLDGFSVTNPALAPIDASGLAPESVVATKTVFLFDLAPIPEMLSYVAAPVIFGGMFAGQIAIQPTSPLKPDQHQYAAVITTGVTDSSGRPILPAAATVLLAGPDPLFANGHTTVNALTDAQAQQLEALRLAFQPLFALLEGQGLPRSRIAALWTFTTESIARPLLALDQFPTSAPLPTGVTLTTVANAATLATLQPALPFSVAGIGWMVLGTFTSSAVTGANGAVAFNRQKMQSGSPVTDTFVVQPPPNAPATSLRFWLSVPQTPPAGSTTVPVAILQHGLFQWRGQMVALASEFAQRGWATIAFDLPLHGARTACVQDTDCAGAAAGSCNTTTGVCANGLAPVPAATDPLTCTLQPISGDAADCRPVASGLSYLNLANLFAVKGNGEQYVLDAAQLVRVVSDATTPTGVGAQLVGKGVTPALDATRLAFLGHSLGGVDGSLFLAAAPQPRIATLNATGGHLFEIIANGDLKAPFDRFLAQAGITRDTPAFAQLEQTSNWIVDAVDPISVARFLVRTPLTSYVTGMPNAPKVLIQQETGMDTTILPVFQAALGRELFGPTGLDANGHLQGRQNDGTIVSTFFPTAVHGTLLYPLPSAAVTASMRAQATTFMTSSGAVLLSP